jgi:molecular chaperone GrpE (heat shock protein)
METTPSHSKEKENDHVEPLQKELKKLHEQLGQAKSEAWRYKRQLLKQFL